MRRRIRLVSLLDLAAQYPVHASTQALCRWIARTDQQPLCFDLAVLIAKILLRPRSRSNPSIFLIPIMTLYGPRGGFKPELLEAPSAVTRHLAPRLSTRVQGGPDFRRFKLSTTLN